MKQATRSAFTVGYHALTVVGVLIGIAVGYNQLRIWQHSGQSYMSELVKSLLIAGFAVCVIGGGILHLLAIRSSKSKTRPDDEMPSAGSQGTKSEFEKLADEDSADMSKRLIVCGTSTKLHLETVDPYIDVTFRIVNASMFPVVSDRVEGNAFYRGYSGEKCYLSQTPIIADPLNIFTLRRADLKELTLRQFVPLGITDNIAANNDALKLDFGEVRVHFRFPGTGGHTQFCWFGDEVEVGGLAVSNETLSKLGIIPKQSRGVGN